MLGTHRRAGPSSPTVTCGLLRYHRVGFPPPQRPVRNILSQTEGRTRHAEDGPPCSSPHSPPSPHLDTLRSQRHLPEKGHILWAGLGLHMREARHAVPQGSRPATSAMSLAVTLGTHGSWPRNSQQDKDSPTCCQNCPSPGQVLEERAPACPAPWGTSPGPRLEEEGKWCHVMSGQKRHAADVDQSGDKPCPRAEPGPPGHRWMLIHVQNTRISGHARGRSSTQALVLGGRPEAGSAYREHPPSSRTRVLWKGVRASGEPR